MEPYLYLAAAPLEAAEVPTLTQPDGVRTLLENPPHTRHDGWNLVTLDRASLIGGTRLRVSNGERKHIDLLADGTMIAIGLFNTFLGWRRWNFTERPKVNGLAVIEFVHDFVMVYEQLLADFVKPRPAGARFAIGVRNAHFEQESDQRRLYLSPGPLGDLYELDEVDRRYAPEAGFSAKSDFDVSPEPPHLDIGRVAYVLVRSFYNWFGHADDAVPYTNDARAAIDAERIRKLA